MATDGPPQYDSKKRLLVVDDHEDNVEVLRARLEARGYEVKGANDGQAALDIVEHWIPDLILLDVMMPKMDGLEVVRGRRRRLRHQADQLR
jgi:CheY-like chemotaxis protein